MPTIAATAAAAATTAVAVAAAIASNRSAEHVAALQQYFAVVRAGTEVPCQDSLRLWPRPHGLVAEWTRNRAANPASSSSSLAPTAATRAAPMECPAEPTCAAYDDDDEAPAPAASTADLASTSAATPKDAAHAEPSPGPAQRTIIPLLPPFASGAAQRAYEQLVEREKQRHLEALQRHQQQLKTTGTVSSFPLVPFDIDDDEEAIPEQTTLSCRWPKHESALLFQLRHCGVVVIAPDNPYGAGESATASTFRHAVRRACVCMRARRRRIV